MASLNVYESCPGGANCKIKFCPCGKDMLPDLEKVITSIEADQRVAALSQINHLLAKKGKRQCLLGMKCTIHESLDDAEAFGESARVFVESFPENPMALAFASIAAATADELPAAIAFSQGAFEHGEGELPETAVEALFAIALTALRHRHIAAARQMLQIHLAYALPSRDARSLNVLNELEQSSRVPLLLKHDCEWPEEDPEHPQWNSAFHDAHAGRWRRALSQFEQFAEEHPSVSKVWPYIAALRGYLCNDEGAAEAWMKYARMPDIDLDTAVVAEATATYLLPLDRWPAIHNVRRTFPVSDTERAMELLLSHPQVARLNIDLREYAAEGQPPPKSVFVLLDRPMPKYHDHMQAVEIPMVLADLELYGKETDREARLVFDAYQTSRLEEGAQLAASILGEVVQPMSAEEPGDVAIVSSEALCRSFHFPAEMRVPERRRLDVELLQKSILQDWSQLPLPLLGGMRPIDAAADPAQRVRLLAAILRMELEMDQQNFPIDCNELRSQLGLPLRSDGLPCPSGGVKAVWEIDLHRLAAQNLTDLELRQALMCAVTKNAVRAIHKLGREWVLRSPQDEHITKEQVLDVMLQTCGDTEQALALAQEGRKVASEAHRSPAAWLLKELELRIRCEELDEVNLIVRRLNTNHGREAGVLETMLRIMMRYGLISPQEIQAANMRGQTAEAAVAATAAGHVHPASAQPPAPASAIWTPGSDRPVAAAGEKSKLWIPGT